MITVIDTQAFAAGCILKQFWGDSKASHGIFFNAAINSGNYNEVLSKSKLFTYNDFNRYLSQKNFLTKEQNQDCFINVKNYSTRMDYLLAYNDNNVEMMINPNDSLIAFYAHMLSNLSLFQNVICIRYTLTCKGFDINEEYHLPATISD